MSTSLIFTIVSERDVRFFGLVGQTLVDLGYKISFLSLFDHELDDLRHLGFEVFVPKLIKDADVIVTPEIIFHEWYTFKRDPSKLKSRYRKLLAYCEALFKREQPDFVIQELGGFSFHHAVFQAALRSGVEHLCIEPAFFKGRYLLLHNCLTPKNLNRQLTASSIEAGEQVNDLIDKYLAHKVVVKPLKDLYHFRTPLQKFFSAKKCTSFLLKLWLLANGRFIAFDYPFQQAWQSLEMVINDYRLRPHRSTFGSLNDHNGHIFYFPLHAPKDVALTLREPDLIDQISLVEELVGQLPRDALLVVKEHPAFKGAISPKMLFRLLRLGVVLIDPAVNSFDIIKRSEGVITINSKAGIEALIQGVPVFAFGRPFYLNFEGVTHGTLSELQNWVRQGLRLSTHSREAIVNSLSHAFEKSHAGELYVSTPENIFKFAEGLNQAISSRNFLVQQEE